MDCGHQEVVTGCDTERDGRIEFYKAFLPLGNPSLTLDDILADDKWGAEWQSIGWLRVNG